MKPSPSKIGIVWSPLSERVGTLEVEKQIILIASSSCDYVFYIGAIHYFLPSFSAPPNAFPIISTSVFAQLLRFNRIFSGRFVVFLQSFISFLFLFVKLLFLRPRTVIAFTCLFPLPIFLLKSSLKPFTAIAFKILCFVQGKPMLLSSDLCSQGWNWRKVEIFLRNQIFKYFYRSADKVICSSPRLSLQLANIAGFNVDLMTIIPNGIVSNNLSPLKSYDFTSSKVVNFVFIGRLTHQKNISDLLDSYVNLRSFLEYPSELHVFGSGDLSVDLASHHSHLNYIHFHGHVDDPWSFNLDNVVVLAPSFWEEPGHVPLEAVEHGFLVLVSTGCSCIDFLPDYIRIRMTFNPENIDYLLLDLCSIANLRYLASVYSEVCSSFSVFNSKSFRRSIFMLLSSL